MYLSLRPPQKTRYVGDSPNPFHWPTHRTPNFSSVKNLELVNETKILYADIAIYVIQIIIKRNFHVSQNVLKLAKRFLYRPK